MGDGRIDLSSAVHIDDAHDVEEFHCGQEPLDRWLKVRARINEANFASRTYVVHRAGQVVGYYAMSAGEVSRMLAPGSVRRNMPDPVPAILLGRLAVDRSMQGRGLGSSLLLDAIHRITDVAAVVGVRVAMVDAISDDAHTFYAHHGFVETLNDPRRLVLDLRNLSSAVP